MRFLEILERAFTVRKCIFCDEVIDYERKEPICDECVPSWLASLDIMCNTCGFDSEFCTCLPQKIREINNSLSAWGVFYTPELQTPANRVVYMLKREHNKDVIKFCADIIHNRILKLCAKHGIKYSDFVITYPPRRSYSVVLYGFDHARLLARELARKMGLELIECFDNVGKKEQKRLTKSSRLSNAAESYVLLKNVDVKGKSIFIVDDVMTTGATLNICSNLLRFAGAKSIIPVTFAKDMK